MAEKANADPSNSFIGDVALITWIPNVTWRHHILLASGMPVEQEPMHTKQIISSKNQ